MVSPALASEQEVWRPPQWCPLLETIPHRRETQEDGV